MTLNIPNINRLVKLVAFILRQILRGRWMYLYQINRACITVFKMAKISQIFSRYLYCVVTVVIFSLFTRINGECTSGFGTFGPTIQETLVTSYISADNPINETTVCRMVYKTPENATLWQGMLAASQQHGENYTFNSPLYPTYGHMIMMTSIRGLMPPLNYWWALFDSTTNLLTVNAGVDSFFVQDGSSHIWQYTANYSFMGNYTGPCLTAPDTPASMPLTYVIAYLTVSSENTEPFQSGTMFKPVCKQLVLYTTNESTLYDVLITANSQVPLAFNAMITNSRVGSLNTLANNDNYAWLPFNSTSGQMLSLDLHDTSLVDGDHIVFRFIKMSVKTTMSPSTWEKTIKTTISPSTTKKTIKTTNSPSTTEEIVRTTNGAPSITFTSFLFAVSLLGTIAL